MASNSNQMTLDGIPPEMRLKIYEYLPAASLKAVNGSCVKFSNETQPILDDINLRRKKILEQRLKRCGAGMAGRCPPYAHKCRRYTLSQMTNDHPVIDEVVNHLVKTCL